ncbi:MAG: HAD-IA family hydrolase [Proteobacteria bacterium]|nr:HAD-IA family hydrolase [Pseudomonadota bacterium]
MAIEVVLFDLGGVVIELGGVQEMAGFAGIDDESELWRRWLACPWVRRFERGLCDGNAFAQGMVESWEMEIAPQEFLRAFAAWPRGVFPGSQELIASIDENRQVACFSNTNEIHAERFSTEFGISELFETRFYSHEMSVLKPDFEAFETVVAALGCAPDRILFLDDNEINVLGARATGLRSECVAGVAEARAILTKNDLLRA